MCGLVGAFRANGCKFPHNINQFLTHGLYISALRGTGGTGVGMVDEEYVASYVKDKIDASTFIFTEQYELITDTSKDSRVLMGHTRSPTGNAGITVKNAHPFMYFDPTNKDRQILLTHNGHISNWFSLTPKSFHHPVDSAHVTNSILMEGDVKTLEKLEGYYVLIWYDQQKKAINIARNTHRDLYYALSEQKDIIYYASERIFLQLILERNNIKYWTSPEGKSFFEVDPFKIYSWDMTQKSLDTPVKIPYNEKKGYMGSAGTNGSGNKNTQNKDTRPFNGTKVGDKIWVDVDSFEFYPGNGDDPTKHRSDYGRLTGHRRIDKIACIVHSVRWSDWNENWDVVGDAFPAKINHIDKKANDSWLYNCSANEEIVDEEVIKYWDAVAEAAKKKEASKSSSSSVSGNDGQLPRVVSEAVKQAIGEDDVKKIEGGSNSTALVVLIAGPDGRMISEKDWKDMAKQGCIYCHGPIVSSDQGLVEFIPWARNPEDSPEDTEYSMMCPICLRDPAKKEICLGA